MARFTYATGYRSWDKAEAALEDDYATGTIVAGELPRIESYVAHKVTPQGLRYSERRWCITLEDNLD